MRTLLTARLVAFSGAVLLLAQDSAKRTGEEGRVLALESAWNHAEQSKDAAALNQLLSESLVYVDYDGTLQNKKEFLQSTLHNDVQQDQINNDGMTVHLYGNARWSPGCTGIRESRRASLFPGAGASRTPGSTRMACGSAWLASRH